MSTEPQGPPVSFIDRLIKPSAEQFLTLEQYLEKQRLALSMLRTYHELLALPHDFETFKVMSSCAAEIKRLSSGVMDILRAGKVQFDENNFQPKHGKTFDPSREIKGFIVGLSSTEKTQVILLDSGLSRKSFDSADELKRKRFARSVYGASPFHSLAFVSEGGKKYKVESYFTVS